MNPYENLPEKSFWKPSVASKSLFDITGLWDPAFNILPNHRIVTFGSCFAQHIGHALTARGFRWLSTEKPPRGLSAKHAKLFNYNVFSARTGNIYTASLLKQWASWALTDAPVPDEIWEQQGRFYDPFRPQIEPNGFASAEELRLSRAQTIAAFRESIKQAHVFVFTLGLTESWVNAQAGHEYPMCPGTVAGDFDAQRHLFKKQQFNDIFKSLSDAIEIMRESNKNLKFLLTVSPVPLTATNSGNHVVVATMESKSILRAVAGQMTTRWRHVDYFPSYEMINSPAFKGVFFEPNLRSVNPYGVNFVMNSFFDALTHKFGEFKPITPRFSRMNSDTVCEEALLEAFGQ